MALSVMAILLIIPASLAQEDLNKQVFLFPNPTSLNYVTLKANNAGPLMNISVCLRYYRSLPGSRSLLSIATPKAGNAFYLSEFSSSFYVSIKRNHTEFRTLGESLDWRHTCVTWDSDTGVIQLWINGKVYPRKIFMKGFAIEAEARIVLGLKHKTFEGQFNSLWPFVGEISDVHMWDYVLSPEELHQALLGSAQGNIINWNALVYEIKGNILVLPKLQCPIVSFYKPCY